MKKYNLLLASFLLINVIHAQWTDSTTKNSLTDIKITKDQGRLNFYEETGQTLGALIGLFSSGAGVIQLNDINGNVKVYLRGNGGNSYFNNGGNIGIGTSTPQHKLEIDGTNNAVAVGNTNNGWSDTNLIGAEYGVWDNTRTNASGTYFYRWTGVGTNYGVAYIGQEKSESDWGLAFKTDAFGSKTLSTSTRMFIKTNGNVGIGTSSPSYRLDVSGQVRVGDASGTTALSNADDLIIESSSNGGISLLVPDSHDANFYIGNPSDNAAAGMRWNYTDKIYTIGTLGTGSIRLLTGNFTTDQGIIIDPSGNVGVGTSSPLSKLSVKGHIRATEVKVLADITVPDYVFEDNYQLRTLQEIKEYIAENKHLPEIPSAAEIGENGIDLGDMNMRLLKKIEELTLYQIELLERIEKAEQKIQQLENK